MRAQTERHIMIQSHEACKAEFAVHKIWENLRLLEDHGICGEAEEALANNSDSSVALTREIMETAKRSFYAVWKAIDPKGYSAATRMEDETWSSRSLPQELPRLRPRKWQKVAKRLIPVPGNNCAASRSANNSLSGI